MTEARPSAADSGASGSSGRGGISGLPSDMGTNGYSLSQADKLIKPLFRVATIGILVSASVAGLALAVVPVAAIFIAGRDVSMGSLIACVVSGVALLTATLIAWAGATTRTLKIMGNLPR